MMRSLWLGFSLCLWSVTALAQTGDVAQWLQQVRAVAAEGKNHATATLAAQQLQQQPISQLIPVLKAMDGANPLAQNWLRGIAESLVARATQQKVAVPVEQLEQFLGEKSHAPRARRLAYELLVAANPAAEKKLIAGLLNDNSLELRRDAVTYAQNEAATAEKSGDKTAAVKLYTTAFQHARDLDQVQELAKKLKELGTEISLAKHLGFLTTWKIVGPFENKNDIGWNTAYEPEAKLELSAEYKGQAGVVKWIDHTTTDALGLVDLTKALDKHKGAVAYLVTEFNAAQAQSVQLRVGCKTAHKIWLNGDAVGERHVYHAGIELDQYIYPIQLKAGKNIFLFKVCQNEQTESWAQDWNLQARLSDELGGAIHAAPATAQK